jgi:formiminoglutamate deiminase
MAVTRYFCDAAFLGADVAARDVVVTVEGDRIADVSSGVAAPEGAVRLRGLTLPGFANTHSHAFHRVLRGRAERPGTFWTWRDEMYAVAAVLDPERYRELASAVFGEMVLAGFSAVGEFHYVHHGPGGEHYRDPNEMAEALFSAAADAGLRITLLDACYLEAAPGSPVSGVQERFSDGDVGAWAARVGALAPREGARVGAAVHSLRAVPPATAAAVAAWARDHGMPLHLHLSEQQAENDEVTAAYGASPVALLADLGVLSPSVTAVHATHLHPVGVGALGRAGTAVCMCPTTERSLADGIGPAAALAAEGSPLCLGTDSHAWVDPFEEMRALELDERLASGTRGHFGAADLLEAATETGHRALGWPDAGRLAAGYRADMVTVSLSSTRLAGSSPGSLLESAVFGAGAADVTDVVVSGRRVVIDGRHVSVDVARALDRAIADVAGAVASV